MAGVTNCPSLGHMGMEMPHGKDLWSASGHDSGYARHSRAGGPAAPASLRPHERHRKEDPDKPPRDLSHRNRERMMSLVSSSEVGGRFCHTAIDNKYTHSFALLLPWLEL